MATTPTVLYEPYYRNPGHPLTGMTVDWLDEAYRKALDHIIDLEKIIDKLVEEKEKS
jgi:hypothetical protein